jgi:hypothetical protein
MSTSAPSISQDMHDVLVPILGNGADPLGVAVYN